MSLRNFSQATDNIAFRLMEFLRESYLQDELKLGTSYSSNLKKREAFYAITDSEFEDVFLYFKRRYTKVGSPYQIVLESRSSDSPSELKIHIDTTLLANLPEQMIEKLDDKYDKLLKEE